jgi:hypothetical protein
VAGEIDKTTDNAPRARQKMARRSVDGDLPKHEQNADERKRSKPD